MAVKKLYVARVKSEQFLPIGLQHVAGRYKARNGEAVVDLNSAQIFHAKGLIHNAWKRHVEWVEVKVELV